MPFKSEEQRRFMWAKKPSIARKWTDKYGSKLFKRKGGKIKLKKGGLNAGISR